MEQGYLLPPHRRFYKRFNLDTSATLILPKNLRRPLILRDLSARGAGVVSNYSLNINEEIEITIAVSFFFNQPVYKKARVVWCNKVDEHLWQAGLDFGR